MTVAAGAVFFLPSPRYLGQAVYGTKGIHELAMLFFSFYINDFFLFSSLP